jgi:hypothetical protein
MVQNVQLRSGSSDPPWNPGAFFTCASERTVCSTKAGRKRTDLILKRVMLTKGMLNSFVAAASKATFPDALVIGGARRRRRTVRRRNVARLQQSRFASVAVVQLELCRFA